VKYIEIIACNVLTFVKISVLDYAGDEVQRFLCKIVESER